MLCGSVAMAVVNLEWSYEFLALVFIALVVVLSLLISVALLIWGILSRRGTRRFVGLCLLISIATYFLIVDRVGTKRMDETFRRGDEIVVALSAFRTRHERYPDSLPQLVPQYLSKIPCSAIRALVDHPFYYQISDVGGFELGFKAAIGGKCRRSESKAWECGD